MDFPGAIEAVKRDWLGHVRVTEDDVSPSMLRRIAAMLDHDPDAFPRGALLPPPPGTADGMRDLGGYFGLHPALAFCHGRFAAQEFLVVHAVGGPLRSRSHFDAQDSLEAGAARRLDSGWLNRAIPAVPGGAPESGLAFSVGVTAPLLLRGPAKVGAWAPSVLGEASADLYARVAALNGADPVTGPGIAEGLRERGFIARLGSGDAGPPGRRDPRGFPALAGTAGRMLAAADGPRIAALEAEGWDTHAAQVPRLTQALATLDAGLAALHEGLGAAWSQTVVLVITEFGRTVRPNGTRGTDHGTGTAALILGGAAAGGQVRADWPGLGPGKLLEDRDLVPATDVRAIAMGVLGQHLGVPRPAFAAIFPDSAGIAPMNGLVRA
jgi:uncharacterized protein (DUF1501 family)